MSGGLQGLRGRRVQGRRVVGEAGEGGGYPVRGSQASRLEGVRGTPGLRLREAEEIVCSHALRIVIRRKDTQSIYGDQL